MNLCLLGWSLSDRKATETPAPRPTVAHEHEISEQGGQEAEATFTLQEPPKLSRELKAEMVLNLPMILFGAALASLLKCESHPATIGCTIPFAVLLWLVVGKWVDRQIKFYGSEPPKQSWFRELRQTLLRAIAFLFLSAAIHGLTPGAHHKTSDTGFYMSVVILWCSSYLICSIWGGRRDRRKAIAA